jgi:hypothetical protein
MVVVYQVGIADAVRRATPYILVRVAGETRKNLHKDKQKVCIWRAFYGYFVIWRRKSSGGGKRSAA